MLSEKARDGAGGITAKHARSILTTAPCCGSYWAPGFSGPWALEEVVSLFSSLAFSLKKRNSMSSEIELVTGKLGQLETGCLPAVPHKE